MESITKTPITNHTEYSWHQHCWDYFVQARTSEHVPHAILLTGENGIGKLALANKMAKSLLCMQPNTETALFEACDTCQSCKTYDSGANPDYTSVSLLQDKQQIGVDQIRELSEFLNYSRSFNTYRVVLLNPVERMNTNAANSLLKSLEEPARNTVLILIASQLSKILPTIKSRCQILSLATPTKSQSLEWLKLNVPELINPEQKLRMASGKPLFAMDIKVEDIEDRESFMGDLLSVIEDRKSVVEVAKSWEKYDFATLINWQISSLQEMIKLTASGKIDTLDDADKYNKILSQLAKKISTEHKWQLYQQLINQKHYIHTSVNALMFVESMILLWLQAR